MKNLKNFFRMTVYFWIIWYVNLAAQPFSFSITSDQRSYTTMENSTQFKGVCLAIAERQPTLFMISPGDIDPPDRILQNLQMW
ncbi:hypothetical protein JW935_10150, partial [candidate division KSB1 bacterium]|nr:hypothetical protein [candidate division KSB1 bacterium]